MSDSPFPKPPELPPGYIVPSHGYGRLRPWRPGEAPNTKGQGGRYHEVMKIAREASPRAMRILTQIMDDPAEDSRCRIVAIQEILGRAFGKIPAEIKGVAGAALNLESVSEQKLELVIRALEAARDAKRAQGDGAAETGPVSGLPDGPEAA